MYRWTVLKFPSISGLGNRARKHRPDAVTPRIGTANGITISGVTAVNTGAVGLFYYRDSRRIVENIRLENISITAKGGGTPTDAVKVIPESEMEYPESTGWGTLPAYGFMLRHVKNISLTNVTVRCRTADSRPAVIADDVDGLTLDRFTANAAGKTASLLNLNDVKNTSVISSRTESPSELFVRVTGPRSERITLFGNILTDVKRSFDAPREGIVTEEGTVR